MVILETPLRRAMPTHIELGLKDGFGIARFMPAELGRALDVEHDSVDK